MNKSKRRSDKSITEADIASQKMGNNQLQGDDQEQVHNQRHAVPEVQSEADEDFSETLDKSDKNVRARTELGKGKGVHPGKERSDRQDDL